jgi:cytochrome c-type biogenesis protein CcmH
MHPGDSRTSQDDQPEAVPAPQGADGDSPPRGAAAGRRRIRTAALSAFALAGLAAGVVAVLVSSVAPPETTAPVAAPGGAASRDGTAPAAEASSSKGTAPAIAGTVSVTPELAGRLGEADTLFIIARNAAGPPFAVKRIGRPRFPLRYHLGPADVMLAGSVFEGEFTLSARLTRGDAGSPQPGDLEGEYPGPVAVGTDGVDILIRRVR